MFFIILTISSTCLNLTIGFTSIGFMIEFSMLYIVFLFSLWLAFGLVRFNALSYDEKNGEEYSLNKDLYFNYLGGV